jgi:murein DD-endopeptidase MepM/ murein hydrolase activator NlpD
MAWPSSGPRTSGYGYRTHPIYGDRRLHTGIDLGPGSGAPIVAALDGTVIARYFSSSYGNLTVIDHGIVGGQPLTTAYAHQSSASVSDGERVRRGQVIGRVGNTGNSTGPHLHFETRVDGDPVDPMRYLR